MAEASRRWTAGRLLKVVGLVPIGLLFLVFLVLAARLRGFGYYGVDIPLAVLWMVVCAAIYGLARLAWRFPITGGVLMLDGADRLR